MKYAENTTVSSESSRNEIERLLKRYGAGQFAYGWQDDKALIAFQMNNKQIKFILSLPNINSIEFKYTPARRTLRTKESQQREYEQAVRQKWRALALVIKAKLEAVSSGITCFENEFLSQIVLPNGQTVGEYIIPQVNDAYLGGNLPLIPLLEK